MLNRWRFQVWLAVWARSAFYNPAERTAFETNCRM